MSNETAAFVFGFTAFFFLSGCTAPQSAAPRPPAETILEERPFVEGEQAPLPSCGYQWCLEKRDAVQRQVTEQVVTRQATSYYETIPAKYESQPEKILIAPEEQRTVLVCPATYRDVPEQRMVEAPMVDYRTIPARYEWTTEEVEVVPVRAEREFIPAQYEEYQERVMTAPARTVRERVPDCTAEEGGCYAARTLPAEYATITKKRLVSPAATQTRTIPGQVKKVQTCKLVEPARVEKVEIPARYQTVMRKELERPAQYRQEIIPAQYRTIEKKVLVVPETQRLVEVPAKYGTVCRTEQVSPERLVWVLKKRPEGGCPINE